MSVSVSPAEPFVIITSTSMAVIHSAHFALCFTYMFSFIPHF